MAVEPYIVLGLHLAFTLLIALLVWSLLAKRATESARPTWVPVLNRWSVASLVYMTLVYGWNFPWFLIPPMVTTTVDPSDSMSNRLSAACAGLGILWMLLYCLPYRVG